MSDVPITFGTGQASVATERIGARDYQIIKVVGGETGSTSVWGINPDRSAQVSIVGTVQVTGSIVTVGNGSVSGMVGASIIGWVPIQPSNTSVITVLQSSSLIGVVTGSVVAIPTGNQSVSGTIGASTIGWVPIQPSNTSVIAVLQTSSVIAVVTGSVVTIPSGNQSVSGAINISGSVLLGSSNASIIAALQSSSIIGVVTGSVVAIPTGNQSVSGAINVSGSILLGSSNASVIALLQTSSVIAINAGSVITISSGSVITVLQAPSIVGTYAEDAASASGDKGFLVMGARNDTLASVTSADGDYSSHVVGPAGELIAENAPLTKWVQGTADFRNGNTGASIIVIGTGGSSVFTYITAVQVANMGPSSVLVTLASGGSTLGYTIAPAGGGSNFLMNNGQKTPANFGYAASLSGIASVLVSAQGFVAKI